MFLGQGTWVQSRAGELRSHKLCGAAKKKKKSVQEKNIIIVYILNFAVGDTNVNTAYH